MNTPTYLGATVYARLNSHGDLVLTAPSDHLTEDGTPFENVIYIEPAVWAAIVAFREREVSKLKHPEMNGSINQVYTRLEARAKHHDAIAVLKEGEDRLYEERLANRDGMCFTLLLEEHHTADDVRIAKRYLRRNRDVVEIDILRPP